MRALAVPALELLGADLPADADPRAVAELIDSRPASVVNGDGAMVDAAFSVPRTNGRRRDVELLIDPDTWGRIEWAPEPRGGRILGYDLTRLGAQMTAGELSERDLLAWAWIFAQNGGRRLSLDWSRDSRYLFTGGADQLARSLAALQRLGWIELTEPTEGHVAIQPTPGSAAIRG